MALGQVHQVRSSNSERVKKIWLWHRLLGNASSEYLGKLLPSLFNGVQDSELKCNFCTLAKCHRVSYPLSFTKREFPFGFGSLRCLRSLHNYYITLIVIIGDSMMEKIIPKR